MMGRLEFHFQNIGHLMIRRILIILFILYVSLVNAESVNSDEISLTIDFGTISIKQQKIEFLYN